MRFSAHERTGVGSGIGFGRTFLSFSLFSLGFFFEEFRPRFFLIVVGCYVAWIDGCVGRPCLGVSIYRNPEPYRDYPIIAIRIGFDFQGRDKILSYPFLLNLKIRYIVYLYLLYIMSSIFTVLVT